MPWENSQPASSMQDEFVGETRLNFPESLFYVFFRQTCGFLPKFIEPWRQGD